MKVTFSTFGKRRALLRLLLAAPPTVPDWFMPTFTSMPPFPEDGSDNMKQGWNLTYQRERQMAWPFWWANEMYNRTTS